MPRIRPARRDLRERGTQQTPSTGETVAPQTSGATSAPAATLSSTRYAPACQNRGRTAPPQATGRWRTVALVATTALVAALAACSHEPGLDPGPPDPIQVTSPTPLSDPLPASGNPVITVDPTAEPFANDPIVAAFRAYVSELNSLFREPSSSSDAVLALTSGSATGEVQREISKYRADGLHLVGVAEIVIINLVQIDGSRWSIVSCEHDSAAFPVGRSGEPAEPTEDRWLPEEHWFIMIDGKWRLDARYRGVHDCGRFQ